jgi:hypothetical protein
MICGVTEAEYGELFTFVRDQMRAAGLGDVDALIAAAVAEDPAIEIPSRGVERYLELLETHFRLVDRSSRETVIERLNSVVSDGYVEDIELVSPFEGALFERGARTLSRGPDLRDAIAELLTLRERIASDTDVR